MKSDRIRCKAEPFLTTLLGQPDSLFALSKERRQLLLPRHVLNCQGPSLMSKLDRTDIKKYTLCCVSIASNSTCSLAKGNSPKKASAAVGCATSWVNGFGSVVMREIWSQPEHHDTCACRMWPFWFFLTGFLSFLEYEGDFRSLWKVELKVQFLSVQNTFKHL